MGYFLPVLLAFILNCYGANVFREQKEGGCEPLVSCLIFLFAVFLLLWDLKLYPSSLRKLWACGNLFLEFLLDMFFMEVIMNDFWLPLDAAMGVFLPKVADFEKDILEKGGWEGEGILQFLREDNAKVVASYLLSIFFLLAVLHATRIVDFRLLSCGPKEFINDIVLRLKRFKRKLLKSILCSQDRIKFKMCEKQCRRRKQKQRACSRSRNDNIACKQIKESYDYDGCDNDYEFDTAKKKRRKY